MKKNNDVTKFIEEKFNDVIKRIDDVDKKVDKIKNDIEKKNKKDNVKKKHKLISEWRKNIQDDCKEKVEVSLEEEAEYFCGLTENEICNIINCPKNIVKKDENQKI